MKKFLSLVLALVMTMSLVTISAGAKDFTDDSKITYEEAVDVMTAVGVVSGYTDGSFNPQGGLTRGAAAKIICNMILGPTTASALNADAAPYKDVPVDNTFAGYIAYCAKEGIISGYADGTFRPAASLTGYAFMKMLLGALGYDASIEGYVGDNWSINVAKRALNIELDKGLKGDFVGSKALTREEACLYAFNTLNSAMVEYETKGSQISVNGIVISSGASAAKPVVDKNNNDVLFMDKYFDDLTKVESTANNPVVDTFGRPAHKWYTHETKRSEKYLVGTYADEADYVIVLDEDCVEANEAATITTLQKYIEDKIDVELDYTSAKTWYNGSYNNIDDCWQSADIGMTIELFCDDDNVERVVAYTYTAAEITAINLDDDDEVESVDVKLLKADTTVTIDVEDDEKAYAKIADLEKDDVFVVVWNANGANNDGKLLLVDEVEAVEGTVEAKSTSWYKVDGTKYTMAGEFAGSVSVKKDGTFYLYDGNLIYADPASEDDTYLFVVRSGEETDKWNSKTIYAEVVFTDGTPKTVEIAKVGGTAPTAKGDVVEGIYTYKYDEKKDTYELTAKDTSAATVTITKGKTAVGSDAANSSTVFVNVKLDGVKFDEAKVYTGYKNVATMEQVKTYVVASKGIAEVVFTVNGVVKNDSKDMIYVAAASGSAVIDDKDLGEYYTYNAVVDGEIVEIMTADVVSGGLKNGSTTNSDDIYTKLDAATEGDGKDYIQVKETGANTKVNFKAASKDVVVIEKVDGTTTTKLHVLSFTDDVDVFVVDNKGVITTGAVTRNYSDVAEILFVQNTDKEVTAFYIVKK